MSQNESNERPSGLTEKQEAFCQEYVKNGYTNASQAARNAGYKSVGDTSSKLLARPHIKERIAQLEDVRDKEFAADIRQTAEQLKARGITPEFVLARLEELLLTKPAQGSIGGHVSGLTLAAKLLGMLVERTADVTDKLGNDPERLEFIRQHGHQPELPCSATTCIAGSATPPDYPIQ